MLYRYGAFVARRARLLLALSLLLIVGAAVLGAGAFGKLSNGGFDDPNAESTRAEALIQERFGGRANLVLLVTPASGTVDDAAAHADGVALTEALAAEPGVTGLVSYFGETCEPDAGTCTTGAAWLRAEGGTDALIVGHLSGADDGTSDRTDEIIDRYGAGYGSLTVRVGGAAGINHDVTAHVTRSLAIAEGIAVPLTMLLLVLAFGSLVAASLPLAVGGVAILGTFAELAVLGEITDVSIFSINLTTALGLGLGIDYALFLVNRFREQLAAGQSVPEAVARTVSTAGRTVIFTAIAVMAALAALLIFPLYFLRSFGYAGIGVVAIAAFGALVLLPALLAVLGHRVNAGRVPFLRGATRGAPSPLWGRLARIVMRRPALAALPVVGLLLLAGSPLLGVVFGTPDQRVLREDVAARQVAEATVSRFPGNSAAPIEVVTTGSVTADQVAAFARTLSRLPGVAAVNSSAGTFHAGTVDGTSPTNPEMGGPDAQRFTLLTSLPSQSEQGQALVRAIRALPGPVGADVLVTGADAALIDTRQAIADRLPLAVGMVLLTTVVILFLFTGSIVQPVRAVLLNGLSLAATLGILTWIFQEGHLAQWLNFTPRPMDMSMTVLLFCIAFGLSMDYEVFVLSRIKELHDAGVPSDQAVPEGLSRSGRIVSTAAGLLAVSFFAFGTSSVSFLQLFGIGAGLAILIDATLVRGVLVPAAMRVLGSAAWYSPRLLRRAHARVALEEA